MLFTWCEILDAYLWLCVTCGYCTPGITHLHEGPLNVIDAGHSMGGALAMLLTAMARLQLRHPAEQLFCQTFGSPPVLAHRGGGGSTDVLQVISWRSEHTQLAACLCTYVSKRALGTLHEF